MTIGFQSKANATPIRFLSGSATYYTETATVDFQFTFSRPLNVAEPNADYFTFGGTTPAPLPNAGEFFIVSTDPTLPSLTALIEFRPVDGPTVETGYYEYSTLDSSFSLTVPFAALGISSSVFQVAGDVCGPHPQDQFDSFGVDVPVFSQIDTPQVMLAEPSAAVLAIAAIVITLCVAGVLLLRHESEK